MFPTARQWGLDTLVIKQASFARGVATWKGLFNDTLPEVAFIGRSNVGKSSLINMLVQRKMLARTSNTPGKTQEMNYYLIDDHLYFVDLPGFGYAKVSKVQREKWRRLIEQYLAEHEPVRLVIHLIDGRHEPSKLDQEIIAFMKGGWVPYLIVQTKIDKLSKNKRGGALRDLKKCLTRYDLDVPVIPSSSKDRTGKEEILQWIEDLVG